MFHDRKPRPFYMHFLVSEMAEQSWKRNEDTSWQIGIKRTMLLQDQFSTLQHIREKLAEE